MQKHNYELCVYAYEGWDWTEQMENKVCLVERKKKKPKTF